MPEEQDDTILILGKSEIKVESEVKVESPASSLALNMLHEDGFKTVLEASCSLHVILTSVKHFTYRVEVFEADELIDAIELECRDLGEGLDDASVFVRRYTAAHEKFKQKVCLSRQVKTPESVKAPEETPIKKTPVKNTQINSPKPSQQYIPNMHHSEKQSSSSVGNMAVSSGFLGQWQKAQYTFSQLKENQNFKLGMVLLAVVLAVLLLGRLLICQLDSFLDKEEKLSYYKQTESFCHKLETGCLGLTKSKMVDETLFTPSQCQGYCDEGSISLESCEVFLDFFKEHKMFEKTKAAEETLVPKQVLPKVEEKEEESVVFLQAEPFELVLGKTSSVAMENLGKQACTVQVKNLLLKESENDEIVQFSGGVAKLNILPEEKKEFILFLEESYYQQFAKGHYTGTVVFSLFFENGKEETLSKDFFFEVK